MVDDLANKAISVDARIVTHMLNSDGRLEPKVRQVWVDDDKKRIVIFRESSSSPHNFSKDIYDLSSLSFLEKDTKKYSSLPILPEGAFEHVLIGGITCSAMVKLDKLFLSNLETKLNLVRTN